jgi:hypothetical protein
MVLSDDLHYVICIELGWFTVCMAGACTWIGCTRRDDGIGSL